MASEMLIKIIPFSPKVFLKVVATDTESTTISIATLFIFFCSSTEMPNFLYIANKSGSTSSSVLLGSITVGAE